MTSGPMPSPARTATWKAVLAGMWVPLSNGQRAVIAGRRRDRPLGRPDDKQHDEANQTCFNGGRSARDDVEKTHASIPAARYARVMHHALPSREVGGRRE